MSLEPNLFVEEIQPFGIKYDIRCDSCAYIDSVTDLEGNSDFSLLNVINVGNGNALNVNIEWDVNYSKFKEKLLEFGVSTDRLNIVPSENRLRIEYENPSSKGDNSSYIGKTYRSHILSASINSVGFNTNIPSSLFELSASVGNAYINHLENLGQFNHEKLLTDHKLKLTYNGTDGRSYTKNYKVQFQLAYNIGSSNTEGVKTYKIVNTFSYISITEKI